MINLLKPGLHILNFHSVTAGPSPLQDWCYQEAPRFESMLRWLSKAPVDVMPLVEGVDALAAGPLRRPTFVLTFDDGYRDNISVALPILKRYGFAATIFLTTGMTGTRRLLWPGRITQALMRTTQGVIDWGGLSLPLASMDERRKANVRLQARVKSQRPADPAAAAEEIATLLCSSDQTEMAELPYALMGEADIREAMASGLIDFGAHTVTHPILSALDDASLHHEVGQSIADVERITGRPCRTFAYPNGRAEDFDDRAIDRIREASVGIAVTTIEGANTPATDPMRLFRWNVGQPTRLWVLRAKLLNLPDALSRRLA